MANNDNFRNHKSCALYARVSTSKQVQEGDSIPAQMDALRKYAKEHNLVVYDEYIDDGISGRKFQERDELQRLLDDLDNIDIIIFVRLDRWFRSIRHYTATQEILDKHNVGWLAVWEPIYDTTTPSGRLIVNQMMSIAQFEAENTGQRIRQVQAYKVSQGEVISGSTPPGYKIVDKHLVPDGNAETVRQAFEYFSLTGSLHQTMREFEDCKDLPHTDCAFKTMLKNEKYIGRFRDNEHFCEPIIDKALFDDVQRKLKINVKVNQHHTYIFSGLMRCSECGTVMAGSMRKHDNHYYRCSKHYNGAIQRCPNQKTVAERTVEKYLLDRIRPEIEKIKLEYEIEETKKQDNSGKIKTLEKKIDKLKELYVNDLITMEEYKADKESYLAQIEELRKPAQEHKNTDLIKLLDTDIESLYIKMSPEEKRYFWRAIIKEIRFTCYKSMEIFFLQ